MNKKNNITNYIKRNKRVELVFKIFPEINLVYRSVLDVINEARQLDEQNVIIQTNESLVEAFLELMNFEYLDQKHQDIDIEKYNIHNKPRIISLFYKAGCDTHTVMAYYYYQKKVDILEKYYEPNIETLFSDYFEYFESSFLAHENECNNNCTKETMEKQRLILEEVKEEYLTVVSKKTALKKASKAIKKKNKDIEQESITTKIRNNKIFYLSVGTFILLFLGFVLTWSYKVYDNSQNTNNITKDINKTIAKNKTTDNIVWSIEFSSTSKIFNTDIVIHSLDKKEIILNTRLKKLPNNNNHEKDIISFTLRKPCLICLGNIYSLIKFNQETLTINNKQEYIQNGIYFIFNNNKLRQITYKEYKKYYLL